MAAKIGILGESTSHTTGTTTLYTVPTDKSAKVRIQCAAEGGSGAHQVSFLIGSPGSEIHIQMGTSSANKDSWTGVNAIASPDPITSLRYTEMGIQIANLIDVEASISGVPWWICPLEDDYELSTGDTVRVTISTQNLLDALFQVHGAEDDA